MTEQKAKNLDDPHVTALDQNDRQVRIQRLFQTYQEGYAKGYSDGLTAQSTVLVDDGHGSAKAHYLTLKDQLEADHFDDYATVGAVSGYYVVASSRVAAVHAFRLQHGDEAAWTFHIGTTR
jgi:hypothetical protein